jgi:ABC-2 type transport system permease protein
LNFWVQFVLGTATELSVAFFLWKSIYQDQGAEILEGFTFHALMYYYLFATFAGKITRGNERGYMAQDIYDGGLTRYLLYPLSFLGYKFVTHLTQQALGIFQLLIALAFFWLTIGGPHDTAFTPFTFVAGCVTCLFVGYLNFAITSCLEMIAFWQDVIWNLLVMLRFIAALLGGAFVPLAFFPEWARELANCTPFPLLVAFPARVFLGQVTSTEWIIGLGQASLWIAVFTFIMNAIWRRGTRQYSGVGI